MSKLIIFKKTLQHLFLAACFLLSVLQINAQCTLTPYNANPLGIVIPAASSCQIGFLSPNNFLANLAVDCPVAAGGTPTYFNLKIYDAAGIVPIYDQNNAGGNNTTFPIIDVQTLGLVAQTRKIRITREPGAYMVEMNIRFVQQIMCPPPATVEANDNITLPSSNVALMPISLSGCATPLTNICALDNIATISNLGCANPLGVTQIDRIVKTSDNSSTACTQTIYFRRINTAAANVTFPSHYTDATNKGCAFTNADAHPNNTGFPILVANNRPLALATAQSGVAYTIGNARITFTDAVQSTACSGAFYVQRTWLIEDVCGATPNRTFVQNIQSNDNSAPTIQPIAALTVNTDILPYNSCIATNFKIPTAVISDNCTGTNNVLVTISNAGFSLATTNGATIPSLSVGSYTIRYTATDACGITRTLDVPLTIADATAPAIVCSSKMIALNNMGTANTAAGIFIDFTNDNCGISAASVQIKRMSDATFTNNLNVTCADIGTPFMVQLKVADLAGNLNYCMTTAEVQDKLAPSFVNLPDTIVNCPVDTNYLKGLNPVVMDGCGFTLTKRITDYNITNCQTGSFKICYTATDAVGLKSTVCRTVTVTNPNPLTAAMLIAPKNITIKNFNGDLSLLEPAKLDTGLFKPAIPTWNYTGCDLPGVSRHDDVYSVNGSKCCFKIIRTWKIANCCMMIPGSNTPKVLAEFVQVIKIEDTLPPEFKGVPTDITIGTQNCVANFTLPSPTNILDCAGFLPQSVVTTLTTMPGKVAGSQLNFANVPKGVYTVTYRATDDCGNVGTTSLQVTVKDITRPTAIAKHGIAANLDVNGSLMINASVFNQGSSDNCTPQNKLKFTFSQNPADSTIMFDCNTFKPMCDEVNIAVAVRLWVRDEASNWDFVDTYITVSKYNTPCSCFKTIAGAIQTTKGDKVEDVLVNIQANGVSIVKPVTTGANGSFNVPTVSGNATYKITPKKDKDPLNGVSTADLILITKHILGQQLFNSPYQYIAADINKSGKISTADLVELRKLVLGVNNLFVNNQSWRFIEKSYLFKDVNNPLSESFPETKQLVNTGETADFIGIKIGDINATASASNATGAAGSRNNDELIFFTDDVKIKKEKTYTIIIKAKNLAKIAGYQFTMNFDKNALEFVDVENTDNGADADFGLTNLEKGVITTSWMNPTSITFEDNEAVFSLTFKGKTNEKLSNLLTMSSDYTKAEAYYHDGEELNVALEFTPLKNSKFDVVVNHQNEFELYQNQPNPFKNNTVVSFNLPQASNATLTVYDKTGRLLKKINQDFEKGRNEIRLDNLGATGLLFYRLETPDHTATRKMLMIND